jgi:hypothetical protein
MNVLSRKRVFPAAFFIAMSGMSALCINPGVALTYGNSSTGGTSFADNDDLDFTVTSDNGMTASGTMTVTQGTSSDTSKNSYGDIDFADQDVGDGLFVLAEASDVKTKTIGAATAAASFSTGAVLQTWEVGDADGNDTNTMEYTMPALMEGLTVGLDYEGEDADGNDTNTMEYTMLEGLTFGSVSEGGEDGGTNTDLQSYAMGAYTVTAGPPADNSESDVEGDTPSFAISYAVNSDITVSYTVSNEALESDAEEVTFSYAASSGPTFTIAMSEESNLAGVVGSGSENEWFDVSVSFAF